MISASGSTESIHYGDIVITSSGSIASVASVIVSNTVELMSTSLFEVDSTTSSPGSTTFNGASGFSASAIGITSGQLNALSSSSMSALGAREVLAQATLDSMSEFNAVQYTTYGSVAIQGLVDFTVNAMVDSMAEVQILGQSNIIATYLQRSGIITVSSGGSSQHLATGVIESLQRSSLSHKNDKSSSYKRTVGSSSDNKSSNGISSSGSSEPAIHT